MISCRDLWSWMKPGYITMKWRKSNSQCSGGIAGYTAPKMSESKIRRKYLAWILWDLDSILLINYLSKSQSINTEYYSSLLVQLEDIFKGKRPGKFNKVVLFLHDNSPANRALPTQKNWPIWASNVFTTHPTLRIRPRRTTTCYLVWKKQMKVRHFSTDAFVNAARRPVWTGNIRIFFWVACKIRSTGQDVQWASWRVCWINPEIGRCSFFLSWSV